MFQDTRYGIGGKNSWVLEELGIPYHKVIQEKRNFSVCFPQWVQPWL